jgi:hypothetical protein
MVILCYNGGPARPEEAYQPLPRPQTRPKSKGSHMCRPLPNITGSHARGADPIGDFGLVGRGITIPYHDRVCASGRRLVGLDLITNRYHSPDLGPGLPCGGFTNPDHRDGGLGIHSHVVSGGLHPGTGWAGWSRVIRVDNVENRRHHQNWWHGRQGIEKIFSSGRPACISTPMVVKLVGQ